MGKKGQLVATHQLEYGGTVVTGEMGDTKSVDLTQDTAIGWLVVKLNTEDEVVAIAKDVQTLGLWGG